MKSSLTMFLSMLLFCKAWTQTQTPVYLSQTITNASCKGFYRYLPRDYTTTTKSYPLIIWVHGAGQLGQGNTTDLPKILEWGVPKIISEGGFPESFQVNGVDHSFIVISPQFMGWPSAVNIGAMISYVSNNFRVDAERIYLMGISAGGGGVWDYASASVANSDKIAAMIPFCGTTNPTQTLAGRIAASKLPVWAFHNTNDGTVPVAYSRNWVSYINSYVPAPTPAAKLTEFPVRSNDAVIAHECWSLATLPTYKPQGINIYEWMLQYKRRITIVNATPVARAGNDSSVVLPSIVTLNGSASSDADGMIAAYRWRKLSGPATHSFSDSTAANTTVSNLSPGTYQFELRVTDNGGATATDNITVTVYGAFAPGTLQRVLIDIGAGTLTTSASINGLYWNNLTDGRSGVRISNAVTTLNLPSGINVQVINRLDGTYNVSANGLGTGNTTGTVNDYPSSATTDYQLIHSSATNGLWRITGMNASKVYTIKFWGSRTGTTALRTAEIKRADETVWKSYAATSNTNYNNAAVFIISGQTSMDFNIRTKSGSDFSALSVLDITYAEETPITQPNKPPVANAGVNVIIQLPLDSTLLKGCASVDTEGAPLKFKWTKIGGPASFQIVNDTICQTGVRGLLAGNYQFELAVTDTGLLVGRDTMNLTVLQANKPPVANAGDSVTIQLPVDSTLLSGCASADPEGAPLKFKWTGLSGPASFQIVNDSICQTGVRGLLAGNYQFELAVTDTGRLVVRDTVNITVLPAIIPVVADAGPDAGITLPTDTVTLSGAASTGIDYFITSYSWRQLSGAIATITSPSLVQTLVTFTSADNYRFELTVTDDRGATAMDTVDIIVSPVPVIPNILPVADAGADKLIYLPPNTITLNGSASYDTDGIISAFKWTKISGPAMVFSDDAIANPSIDLVTYGIYTFELMVTDSSGDNAKDTMVLTVNNPVVAIAGPDAGITLPTDTVTLNGAGSTDAIGSITSFSWRQLSGVEANITSPSSVQTIVIFTAADTYRFELSVTDDLGATATDTVDIIVLPVPNILPVADAGADTLIQLQQGAATLNGSASFDSDGTIVAWKWRKITGPAMVFSDDTIADPSVNSLTYGVYVFELMVTDNRGDTAKDTMVLTVNNPPVANAGADKLIHLPPGTTTLNGSASFDSDGSIVAWKWRDLTGSTMVFSNDSIANPLINSLTNGVYNFELTVTDNYGATANDTMVLTVNNPPVANAGEDRLINLPPNTTMLNGSASFDSDGTIVTWKWRKITGPTMVFSNDAIANPAANSLTFGIYSFELVVTDNKGATAKDTMVLTVNNPPVANAGTNTGITLPTNTVTLSGAASTDVDGSLTSYGWRQVSGAAATITSPSLVQTVVTFSTADTYRFELTITDNRGVSAKDSVDIIVSPVPTTITKTMRVNIFGGTNPYNNAQWNNWNMTGSLTSAKFNYDDGTASNVNAVITASSLISDNGATYAATATACPPQVLRYTSANTSYRTLTFSGMTNTKTYNLEFYGSRANTGNSSTFQVGNRLDTISTDNNLNDAARFTNIIPDNTGRIIVTINRIGTWNYLSGFIITEITGSSSLMSSSRSATGLSANPAMAEKPVTGSETLFLYPNPGRGIIYLNLPAGVSGQYKVNLMNINGQTVMQKTGTKRNTGAGYTDQMNIRDLPKGMYLLKVYIQNKNITSTIIKL